MNRFVVLYRSTVAARAQMATATPEQAKAGMAAWMAWAKKNNSSVVDLGSPLGDSAKVGADAGASDAPIGGYSIVQGESLDAVKGIFADHPHLRRPGGTWIDVLEVMALPGMESQTATSPSA